MTWTGLLRPAAGFTTEEASGPCAGHLGGEPALPIGTGWPEWPGHGPLTFIASVDCAALPTSDLDIDLPASGTLQFFYFDGQFDDDEALVEARESGSQAGARVIYVPAGAEVTQRTAPTGIEPYPRVPLAARTVGTFPDITHPVARAAFPEAFSESCGLAHHAVGAAEFREALFAATPQHRVGGHAVAIQGSVEREVARGVLGRDTPGSFSDPALLAEAAEWVLLAQIDSDWSAEMCRGDMGTLYWFVKPADLAAHRFDRTWFGWQCT
ncbi:YwqG family protein [Nocardiopsis rhodophaea]|uniref:YwqG family protein n=1 Tax=Nocardiopsis rhodophaea TaxID=280238 RepID=UPI0031CDFCF9